MLSNQQILINKRQLRAFKYLILSPQLEKIALFSYLTLFLLILVYFSTQNFRSSSVSASFSREILQKSQEFFENQRVSLDFFLDFLEKELVPAHFSANHSFYKPLGALRILQYRLETAAICDNSQEIARFSKNCNPFFLKDWSDFLRKGALPEKPWNFSMCVEEKCQEFDFRYVDFVTRTTAWKDYPNTAYFVEISQENFAEKMQKLRASGFFSANETVAVICEWNAVDLRFFSAFASQIFLEMPSKQQFSLGFRWSSVFYREVEDFFSVVIVPLYLFIVVLLSFKGIFELSYFDNKITSFCNLFTYLVNLLFAIALVLENAQYRLTFPLDIDNHANILAYIQQKSFVSVNKIVFYQYITQFFLQMSVIPFPFKFLELVTWVRCFQFLQKFLNMLYRTFQALLQYILSFAVLSLGWTLGFYLLLRSSAKNCTNFPKTGISLFFGAELGLNFEQIEVFSLFSLVFAVVRGLTLGFLLVVLVFSVFKASEFEYPQFYESLDKETNESLARISAKIDKFVEKHLPSLQQDAEIRSFRMLVWLQCGVSCSFSEFEEEVAENCRLKEIKLLIFKETQQILQFLGYLFRLKPNLAFRKESLLRILVDFGEETQENPQSLLQWLQDYGSRAAVLLIFKEKMPFFAKNMLQRLYKYVLVSEFVEDAKEFASFQRLSEIKWGKVTGNTFSEMDSSVFSHSFELENNLNNVKSLNNI